MSKRATDASQYLLRIATGVATHGFAVIPVGYGECSVPGCCGGQRLRRPWTYTIGLSEAEGTELMLFGLDPVSAHYAISLVVDSLRLRWPELPLDAPMVIDGMDLKLIEVPDSWLAADPSRMAMWFHHYAPGRSTLAAPRVRQLVWADYEGRFPDDPSCDPEVVATQPILSVDPLAHPKIPPRHIKSHRKGKPGR